MNSVLAGIFLPAEETHSSAIFAKKQGFEGKSTSESCGIVDLANDISSSSLRHLQPHGSILASCEEILSDEDRIPGFHRSRERVVIHRQHFGRTRSCCCCCGGGGGGDGDGVAAVIAIVVVVVVGRTENELLTFH